MGERRPVLERVARQLRPIPDPAAWALQQRLREQSSGRDARTGRLRPGSENRSAAADFRPADRIANCGRSLVGPNRIAQQHAGAPNVEGGEDSVRSDSVLPASQATGRTEKNAKRSAAVTVPVGSFQRRPDPSPEETPTWTFLSVSSWSAVEIAS